jgi:hypothetical protein
MVCGVDLYSRKKILGSVISPMRLTFQDSAILQSVARGRDEPTSSKLTPLFAAFLLCILTLVLPAGRR